MAFSQRQSETDLHSFSLSRRSLLGKLPAIGAALLLPQTQSQSLPSPKFKVGDLVAYDWEPDDDEAPESATDFGEVLGMRWVPKPDSYSLSADTWVYFVRWTHGTCGSDICYPCYDGEPTRECDLRLVRPEEVCTKS
jgi:hypothetical protein